MDTPTDYYSITRPGFYIFIVERRKLIHTILGLFSSPSTLKVIEKFIHFFHPSVEKFTVYHEVLQVAQLSQRDRAAG